MRSFEACLCLCLLTSPVSDGADCPRAWLLIRTRLFTSPPPDAPPTAPGPPKPPERPCQASWLTPACRLLDKGSSCLPGDGEKKVNSNYNLVFQVKLETMFSVLFIPVDSNVFHQTLVNHIDIWLRHTVKTLHPSNKSHHQSYIISAAVSLGINTITWPQIGEIW